MKPPIAEVYLVREGTCARCGVAWICQYIEAPEEASVSCPQCFQSAVFVPDSRLTVYSLGPYPIH